MKHDLVLKRKEKKVEENVCPPAGTSYPRKKGHVDGPSNSFRETGEHLDARNSVQKESVTGPTTQYAYDISRYTSR